MSARSIRSDSLAPSRNRRSASIRWADGIVQAREAERPKNPDSPLGTPGAWLVASMQGTPLDQQIAAYLVRHPEAQDTIEGIAEWWLLEQRIQVALAEIRGALTQLAARGFLTVNRGRDGRIRFSLNPSRQSEVTAWLSEASGSNETVIVRRNRSRTAPKSTKPRAPRRSRGRS